MNFLPAFLASVEPPVHELLLTARLETIVFSGPKIDYDVSFGEGTASARLLELDFRLASKCTFDGAYLGENYVSI